MAKPPQDRRRMIELFPAELAARLSRDDLEALAELVAERVADHIIARNTGRYARPRVDTPGRRRSRHKRESSCPDLNA